ncbi:hypothetical protein G5S52_06280 [Grimontia sp. S25]|uniref:Uncharacterized protein n=1 Tax=Grimontia sedimenti TaxID=2711294 RepID=A0A6M1RI77_9GAMM|nr:hypothetical protein [Grimontia sedimenti]NGN97279.1 hypothetical protein [Grimontia sedimenti]
MMSKQVEHHETNINAGDNSIVATHSANVATGNATIDNSTNLNINGSIDGLSNDKLAAIQELITFVKSGELNTEDESVAKFIVEDIEQQFSEESPNAEKILSFSNKLVSLIESAKPIAANVVKAIELLKG